MKNKEVQVVIIQYPGAMLSAVQGLKEVFQLANGLCEQHKMSERFVVRIHDIDTNGTQRLSELSANVVLIPPDLAGDFYLNPDSVLIQWLSDQHKHGAILCSACAGSFILAATGVLNQREATTHWNLADSFAKKYPDVNLDSNKILSNAGDVITAGGLMSWLDLGMELVGQITNQHIMRQLGKYLVIDTGLREQRYYESFSPTLDHGDADILKVQRYMQLNLGESLTMTDLSERFFLTERTFLRRFFKATDLKPAYYLQRLRIQKACDLIETTNHTFDVISYEVGYGDPSAFRKTFVKIIGLTPREFRSRFTNKV